MDGGRPRESPRGVVRHVHTVQSTIQGEIGVTVVKIATFRAHHKAACVKWGRKYSTISTVCMCESRCFSYNHSVGRFFLSMILEQTKRLLRLASLLFTVRFLYAM